MKHIIFSPSRFNLLKTSLLAFSMGAFLPVSAEADVSNVEASGSDVICGPDANSQRRLPGIANSDCIALEKDPENVKALPEKSSPTPRPVLLDYENKIISFDDRWRIVELVGYEENLLDPYNRNVLKADRPLYDDWFFNVSIVSDTFYENRRVPTPVGLQSTRNSGDLGVFGSGYQQALIENLLFEFVYYKGDTTFRPPDYEFRFIPVINYNATYLDEILGVNVDPADNTTRYEDFIGIQGLFVDKHLRNVSDNFDFDSLRVGIQPFNSDFRGFLFQDSPFGVRLFGNRSNNIFQYNLAWFRRLEKDINSGLNDVRRTLRDDDIFVANLYWQDMPVLGFFSQATIIHNRNGEEDNNRYDENGFIQRPASLGGERPKSYEVTYFGYNGDGHIGRLNLTVSAYQAIGTIRNDVFSQRDADINAQFFAAELSRDYSWARYRLSAMYGSGDSDPYDDVAEGFDAIFENPQFAGADTSYWMRQGVPLIAGGKVAISSRNGLLNSLRTSKEQGQSNFTNPGIRLLGAGADWDLLPELRVSFNVNRLWFDDTTVIEVARNQGDIDTHIGDDVSIAIIYRPFMSQNIVARASYAKLFAGQGYKDLFPDEDPHSLLLNLTLSY
ncbi:hypothetical protein [Thalassolituus sp.]|uniref:hypothetical protein n=1 Tax=Thalassolituus sp. TaxID=2030822 RepID=UPI002A824288|nr:hypothetical protein [Thalassolituus sp.]